MTHKDDEVYAISRRTRRVCHSVSDDQDCVEVASRERLETTAATKTGRVTERIFVQERHARED